MSIITIPIERDPAISDHFIDGLAKQGMAPEHIEALRRHNRRVRGERRWVEPGRICWHERVSPWHRKCAIHRDEVRHA